MKRPFRKRPSRLPASVSGQRPADPADAVTRKLYIKTFGCQMNEYDSDRMADVLALAEGVEPTDDPAQADIILFNTCSVREKAQEKVFSDLGRVRALKRERPGLIVGVGGCVASQEGEAIVARAPYVDVVFGPQTLHRLPELIARRRGWKAPPPSFPSWKAAANIAASVWCPTRAAPKCRVRSKTSWWKSPIWPTRASRKSPCWART